MSQPEFDKNSEQLVMDADIVGAWKLAPNSSRHSITIPEFKLLCEYALKGLAAERALPSHEATPTGWREALRQIRINLDAGGRSPSNHDFLHEHGGALLDKVEEALDALPSTARPTGPEACKHGIRWPHECRDCEQELSQRMADRSSTRTLTLDEDTLLKYLREHVPPKYQVMYDALVEHGWGPVAASATLTPTAYEKARADRLTEDPCKCGLMKVPVGVDGCNWYWQRHTREGCTLELPDATCWCGLKRSEHVTGHSPDGANGE